MIRLRLFTTCHYHCTPYIFENCMLRSIERNQYEYRQTTRSETTLTTNVNIARLMDRGEADALDHG